MIVGLGKTGISCARYFASLGKEFSVVDDNVNPDRLSELHEIDPQAFAGKISEDILLSSSQLVLSPGVPLHRAEIRSAIDAGIAVTGDVEIFSQLVEDLPLIAITGSNGKSTVTELVGHILKENGYAAGVGGNLGKPCLDLLKENAEIYVIEVSSFQLDTTSSLPCTVSTVLNLAPDHMDRYENLDDYYQSKTSIYKHCDTAVVNRDVDYDFDLEKVKVVTFGSGLPEGESDFGLWQKPLSEKPLSEKPVSQGKETWLVKGQLKIISGSELRIKGKHNFVNALAAMAICESVGVNVKDMVKPLSTFGGLEHRCEWIGQYGEVTYYNDSKSTNLSSTLAAIEGLGGDEKNISLILGGQGKEADFSQLNDVVNKYVKQVILFGEDAELIRKAINQDAVICTDFNNLVPFAEKYSDQVSVILFSPGCASFDLFSGFEERGEKFKAQVRRLLS